MSEGGSAGSICPKPGRKKLAGEMLCEALMPLQPAPRRASKANSASLKWWHFSFTRLTIGTVDMIATPISTLRGKRRSPFLLRVFLLFWGWMGLVGDSVAADSPDAAALAQARKAYDQAREIWRKSPDDTDAPWQFAQACFDLAEVDAPNRARISEEGIAACRTALKRKPDVAGTHYYLALNVGQLARTKNWGASGFEAEWNQG